MSYKRRDPRNEIANLIVAFTLFLVSMLIFLVVLFLKCGQPMPRWPNGD